MKNKYVAFLCVLCLAIGFVAGRNTLISRTEIKYVKGEVVRDTIHLPVPVREVISDTILLIERDTIQTLVDWNTERYYADRVLDDNNGILDFTAKVQFNRLQLLSYELVPIRKEITRYKSLIWQPYIGISYNTFNHFSISGGLFRNKTGIELQYITDFKRKGYGVGLKHKF